MFLSLLLSLYSCFLWFPPHEFNQCLFCAPNKAAAGAIRFKLKGQSLTEAAEPLPDKKKKKGPPVLTSCWTLKSWHVGHLSVTQEEQQTDIEAFPKKKREKTHHVSILEKKNKQQPAADFCELADLLRTNAVILSPLHEAGLFVQSVTSSLWHTWFRLKDVYRDYLVFFLSMRCSMSFCGRHFSLFLSEQTKGCVLVNILSL